MSRQKLLHLHTSGTTAPTPSLLELGEIAVQYNNESPLLYIKDNNGNIRKFIDYEEFLHILDNRDIDGGDYGEESGGEPGGDSGEYEYVDLGLPSGTLWATYNIGASSPDEPGSYFQWGDISGYTSEEDWTIPTNAQFTELLNNTTYSWDSSRSGMTFTANGKELFLFGAGYIRAGGSNNPAYGMNGRYWSCTSYDSNYAWGLRFSSAMSMVDMVDKTFGISVRPVRSQNH